MGVMGKVFKNLAPKGTGNITTMGVIGAAASAPFTYMDQVNQGKSSGFAAAYAGVEAAGWLFAEPLMWGITLGQLGVAGTQMAIQEARDNAAVRRDNASRVSNEQGTMVGSLGGRFIDTEETATLRQRQASILRQHRIATETILGSEARQLHR